MSKILELPKFKPIICNVCGCKYEFEEGDELQPILYSPTKDCKKAKSQSVLTLPCPVCGKNNKIKLKVEE